MLYAQVNDEARQVLQDEMKSTGDKKWYRRLKVIELSARGYGVPELAALFDLSAATIRSYIQRYNQGGLAVLKPGYGSGRPPEVGWTQDEWLALLHQAPCQFEALQTGAQNWTQALLQQYLAVYCQQSVTQGTISRCLRRVGITWRRAKLKVTSPDPLYVVKRQRLEELKQKALTGSLTSADATHPPPDGLAKRAYLVFFDATDLHWCPDVGSSYRPAGQQRKVDSPGYDNPWLALLGSLVFPSGEGLYTVHQRKRHQEVAEHLRLLMNLDPDAFWFVVLDNASAHTTSQLNAFWQQYADHLEPVYLPSYSPHLNLIETLWRFMRSQVTRNHFATSLTALAETVVNWLYQLPFARFCSLMGLDGAHLRFV